MSDVVAMSNKHPCRVFFCEKNKNKKIDRHKQMQFNVINIMYKCILNFNIYMLRKYIKTLLHKSYIATICNIDLQVS